MPNVVLELASPPRPARAIQTTNAATSKSSEASGVDFQQTLQEASQKAKPADDQTTTAAATPVASEPHPRVEAKKTSRAEKASRGQGKVDRGDDAIDEGEESAEKSAKATPSLPASSSDQLGDDSETPAEPGEVAKAEKEKTPQAQPAEPQVNADTVVVSDAAVAAAAAAQPAKTPDAPAAEKGENEAPTAGAKTQAVQPQGAARVQSPQTQAAATQDASAAQADGSRPQENAPKAEANASAAHAETSAAQPQAADASQTETQEIPQTERQRPQLSATDSQVPTAKQAKTSTQASAFRQPHVSALDESEDNQVAGSSVEEESTPVAAKGVKTAKAETQAKAAEQVTGGSDKSEKVDAQPAGASQPAAEHVDPATLAAASQTPATSHGVQHQAVAATAPAATPEQRFVENNHADIVASVRTQLLPRGGTMQLRLDPPELGALQVTVQMRDGVMTASFQTSGEEATRLLSHSLTQLKASLESQGVTVDRLHVQQAPRQEAGSNNGGQDSDGQPRQQGNEQSRQEQQRREMLQRMWRRVALGRDPLDVTG